MHVNTRVGNFGDSGSDSNSGTDLWDLPNQSGSEEVRVESGSELLARYRRENAEEERLENDVAKTYDDGKEPLAVLPWAAIDELALVQAYGHKKYGDFYNYRKGMEVSRNLSCAIRHIRDYMEGADEDHESGCHPLGHALTRIAFVLQNIADGVEIDDRYRGR